MDSQDLLSDIVYLDAPNPNKAATVAFHAGALEYLRRQAEQYVGSQGPLLVSSSQRLSGGSTQRYKRTLHTFGVPPLLAQLALEPGLEDEVYVAIHSKLVSGPIFIVRLSELTALASFLRVVHCSSVVLVSAVSAAVVPDENGVALLTQRADTIALEEGVLLQVRSGGTGETLYSRSGRGGRALRQEAVDVVRIVGMPTSWTPVEVHVFFTQLGRAGIFTGEYTLERPVRPDGSLLEQVRCTCSLMGSAARLITLGQTTVSSPGRGTALLKFQSVSQTFQWSTAPDAAFAVVARGVYPAVEHAP